MTSLTSIFNYLNSFSPLTNHVSAFSNAALHNTAYFARKSEAQITSAVTKTKDGINTISEYAGLLKPAFRTITGIGEVITPPEESPYEFPDNWIKNHITAGEQNVTYAEAMIDDAIGTYVVTTGHGTESAYYKPWVERANKLGFNVVIMELPDAKGKEHFPNGDSLDIAYQKAIGDTVLNPESPLFQKIPDWHPISIVTHSASGGAFEINIKQDIEKARFADRFAHIFHTAIMLDTANSSDWHFPMASAIYKKFSQFSHIHDKKLGSTEIDRYWLKNELEVNHADYMFQIQSNPTHGQAALLKNAGIKHITDVKNKKGLTPEFMSLKRTIIMGDNDTGACPLTAKDYAGDVHGINHVSINDVKHNPIMECSQAYALISKTTRRSAQQNLKRIRHQAQLQTASSFVLPLLNAPHAA